MWWHRGRVSGRGRAGPQRAELSSLDAALLDARAELSRARAQTSQQHAELMAHRRALTEEAIRAAEEGKAQAPRPPPHLERDSCCVFTEGVTRNRLTQSSGDKLTIF